MPFKDPAARKARHKAYMRERRQAAKAERAAAFQASQPAREQPSPAKPQEKPHEKPDGAAKAWGRILESVNDYPRLVAEDAMRLFQSALPIAFDGKTVEIELAPHAFAILTEFFTPSLRKAIRDAGLRLTLHESQG